MISHLTIPRSILRRMPEGNSFQKTSKRNRRALHVERLETRRLLATGDALHLDGVAAHVSVAEDPALFPREQMTVEAWVRSVGNGDGCVGIIGGSTLATYRLELCDDRVQFTPYLNAQIGSTEIPNELWTHIAVTWDRGGDQTFYINGDLEHTGAAGTLRPEVNGPITIGRYLGGQFSGYLSEVRVWSVVRTQDQIRHTMHLQLEEARPGLVANWHFSEDMSDAIGDHDGIALGGAARTGFFPPHQTPDPPAPTRPHTTPIDLEFGSLSHPLYGAATVVIPEQNEALVIGGARKSGFFSPTEVFAGVSRVDLATGNTSNFDAIPARVVHSAGEYVASKGEVFLFGGQNEDLSVDFIQSVSIESGATRIVGSSLPQSTTGMTAVYHPEFERIYLFGGATSTGSESSVLVFNPETEAFEPSSIRLPEGRSFMTGEYSTPTGDIFLFGGNPDGGTGSNTIYRVTITGSGHSAVFTTLHSTLRNPAYGQSAAEDEASGLIYLVGGRTPTIDVFDPVTGQLWTTPIEYRPSEVIAYPGQFFFTGAAYSRRNRHLVTIGGSPPLGSPNAFGTGSSRIVRIPVGNGPTIPLGRWDFPAPLPLVNNGVLNSVSGEGDRVFFGTDRQGAYWYDQDGTRRQYGPAYLVGPVVGATQAVNDVQYDSNSQTVYMATSNQGVAIDRNGSLSKAGKGQFTVDTVLSVDAQGPLVAGTAGDGVHVQQLVIGGGETWRRYISSHHVPIIARRGIGNEFWVLAGIAGEGGFTQLELWRVNPDSLFNPAIRYGRPSLDGNAQYGGGAFSDLVFDPDANWWISSDEGIIHIPAANNLDVTDAVLFRTENVVGNNATSADVDAEGRVWFSLEDDSSRAYSGGLTAYQSSNGSIRAQDYSWLDAPVGTNRAVGSLWDSSFARVGAADERVWATRGGDSGELVTVAQRWQQLDESNRLDQKAIERIWTVRGRVFMAAQDSLHVLMPNGETWDNRNDVRVNDVFADDQGRIWVGTDNGLRIYTANGWDPLSGFSGEGPTGKVQAITQDNNGWIWIGSDSGLTLLAGDRFSFTLTPGNFGLPSNNVTSLLVDKSNQLWIGTDNGLTSFDYSQQTIYRTAQGLSHNAIHDLALLDSGQIAISTANGLDFFDGQTLTRQSIPVDDSNLPLSVDELGRLWAGSAVRTGDQWQGYYWTNSGLSSSMISDNATDMADRVWFSHAPDTGVSVRGSYLPPLADSVPIVSHVLPRYATSGDVVEVHGSGFGTTTSDLRVTIGGASVQIQSVEDDVIHARIGDSSVTGAVSVTKGKRTSVKTNDPNGGPLFCAVPTLSRFTPTGGNVGVEVTVTGTNFDPDIDLDLGSGFRSQGYQGPTTLRTWVQSADVDGQLRLRNSCGVLATTESEESFNKLEPSVQRLILNQGMHAYGLVQDKPTLFSYFVGVGDDIRTANGLNDVIEIDQVEITITRLDSGQKTTITRPVGIDTDDDGVRDLFAIPTRNNALTRSDVLDIQNSLNFSAIYPEYSGQVSIDTKFERNRSIILEDVTSHTMTTEFGVNNRLEMLLVPIMETGASFATFQRMKDRVDTGLQHLKERIYPFGTVDITWGSRIFTDDQQDINDVLDLYHMSHQLDEERERQGMDRAIVMGVAHDDISDGTGQAFWPDLSNLLNGALLNHLDVLCDAADVTLSALTFGIHEAAGCDLTIPLYTGWIRETDTREISRIIGHEMGHTLGLVKPWADNGDITDNFTHSVNDELSDGECTDGSDFDFNLSLYRQPGVTEPIVDPIAGTQFYPEPGGQQFADHAKSIMSYACQRENENVFFEPTDLDNMLLDVFPIIGPPIPPPPPPPLFAVKAGAEDDAPKPQEAIENGSRLRISGSLQPGPVGEIAQVTMLENDGSLSLNFQSDFKLLQLNDSGQTLSETGVVPYITTSADPMQPQLFATTIRRADGVTRIELRNGNQLLDAFEAGSNPPSVQITQPQGGGVSQGTLTARWIASDPNGDALRFHVDYSNDGGQTWHYLGSTDQTSLEIAYEALQASNSARIRVTASDSLNTTQAVSEPFTVANHAPTPIILAPLEGDPLMEGQSIHFSGVGFDVEDEEVDAQGLRWTSDRSGLLGVGQHVFTSLRGGMHEITLQATDSSGRSATTTVSVDVQGDFDIDGIPDVQELSNGLNPIALADAFSDEDNDGISRRVEMRRNLNPLSKDSDQDGRTDSTELVNGTLPGVFDSPLVGDQLKVHPAAISTDLDLSHDVPLTQWHITVTSRSAVDWNVTTAAPWLSPLTASGETPDGLTVRVEAYMLPDGLHQSGLTFYSQELRQQVFVPITVRVINHESYLDIDRNLLGSLTGTLHTEADYDYRLDINRDGLIDSQDVMLVDSFNRGESADLNNDGQEDESDIAFLCDGFGSANPNLDLNNDGTVGIQDLEELVHRRFTTTFGDANLDGVFNSSDLVLVLQSGEYEDSLDGNSTWSEGDWNCNGDFTSSDLILALGDGGYQFTAIANRLDGRNNVIAAALQETLPKDPSTPVRSAFAIADPVRDTAERPKAEKWPMDLRVRELIFADDNPDWTRFAFDSKLVEMDADTVANRDGSAKGPREMNL